MKFLKLFIFLGVAVNFYSCNNDKFSLVATKTVLSDFETTSDDWTGALADDTSAKSPIDTSFIKVVRVKLPTGMDTLRYGLAVKDSSNFIYLKKMVTGLRPETNYSVNFNIRLGTNITPTSVLAKSTYLKVGAAPIKPLSSPNKPYIFNLDKGKGGLDGKSMIVLGNISNDLGRAVYTTVERNTNGKTVQVRANEQGIIWLCVGIDSGYKGNIFLYFDRITATISEISNN